MVKLDISFHRHLKLLLKAVSDILLVGFLLRADLTREIRLMTLYFRLEKKAVWMGQGKKFTPNA